MAAHGWGTNRPLRNFLFEEGHLFDFYQAVRLIEKLRQTKAAVATNVDPSQDAVRFKSKVTLGFPASDIETIKPGRIGGPPEVVVNFMGLAGAFGPLPNPFVELLIERESQRDTGFRDFLDLFNNRLISLMYRVRKIHRLGIEMESPERVPFAQYLFALMGLGTKNVQNRLKVKDRAFLFYTGLFAQKPHSMSGLERLLSHYFRVKVKGSPLHGRWHFLERDQTTILGPSGQNCVLGESAVLGRRIWDQQTRFRLLVGPLKLKEFEEFLPVGSRFRPLVELTAFYVGRELEFDINLVVKAREAPQFGLSTSSGPRLGWTSWLKTAEFQSDDNQVVLHPSSTGEPIFAWT